MVCHGCLASFDPSLSVVIASHEPYKNDQDDGSNNAPFNSCACCRVSPPLAIVVVVVT